MYMLEAIGRGVGVASLVDTEAGGGAPWGVFLEGSSGVADAQDWLNQTARVGVWTGTAQEADDGLEGMLATWSPGAMAALNAACDRMLGRLEATGSRLLLRPHARHVLSDVQRCLIFLNARRGQPIGLILDPAAMIDVSMLAKSQDHLQRSIETLGPLADAVWLSNLAGPESEGGEVGGTALEATALSRGVLNPGTILTLVRTHVGAGTPLVVSAEDRALVQASMVGQV